MRCSVSYLSSLNAGRLAAETHTLRIVVPGLVSLPARPPTEPRRTSIFAGFQVPTYDWPISTKGAPFAPPSRITIRDWPLPHVNFQKYVLARLQSRGPAFGS